MRRGRRFPVGVVCGVRFLKRRFRAPESSVLFSENSDILATRGMSADPVQTADPSTSLRSGRDDESVMFPVG